MSCLQLKKPCEHSDCSVWLIQLQAHLKVVWHPLLLDFICPVPSLMLQDGSGGFFIINLWSKFQPQTWLLGHPSSVKKNYTEAARFHSLLKYLHRKKPTQSEFRQACLWSYQLRRFHSPGCPSIYLQFNMSGFAPQCYSWPGCCFQPVWRAGSRQTRSSGWV